MAGVSPATLRNAEPILAVLRTLFVPALPAGGLVVEVASGAGYHASVFARALPQYRWQPTEASAQGCAEMAALVTAAGLSNLAAPVVLDVTADPWPVGRADAVVCINMIHISPWEATLALFAGAGRILPAGGLLITYGPYLIAGDFQADSNRVFDQSLRARNPRWGIRDVTDLATVAKTSGFDHMATTPMPANNHILAFRKTG
ncbi:MAG: DUF938 domain-containing protein [Rhodospirillaceae bacterium]|nr:MAG: DUF938 domain-containing protein [Rhodospirillaceae bacterium]